MIWKILSTKSDPSDILGFLPMIFNDEDPRPAAEQAEDRYAHGGGWHPQDGWRVNPQTGRASYPGDPSQMPVAWAMLNAEKLLVYPFGYVCVIQPDGSFEMSRMD